jgi:predicted acylesterase/phospholipase RssA
MFQILLILCFLGNALSAKEAKKMKTCNILSFSGAGSFGAVEVGILDRLSSSLPTFDMLTGVSAGGLNVGFLSYYSASNNSSLFVEGITELKNTYFEMTNDSVFQHNTAQIARTWSYYDTAPLRKTIESKLAHLSYRGIPTVALIGSTNLNKGVFQIFEFQKESKLRQVQIMMATSAIPLAFPPENIQGIYYVDGGAVANEIISGVESFLAKDCDNYNFTFITASEGLAPVKTIDSLNDYIRRVVKVVMTDFNNELAEIIDAPCYGEASKGAIQICHPSTKGGDYLSKYSSMDFSYGKELYEIGYNHFTCDSYPYC